VRRALCVTDLSSRIDGCVQGGREEGGLSLCFTLMTHTAAVSLVVPGMRGRGRERERKGAGK
jgi:hypothetical protein